MKDFPIYKTLISEAEKSLSEELLWDGRDSAFHSFLSAGFPGNDLEKWRNTPLDGILTKSYDYIANTEPINNININQVFKCEIHHFDTYMFTLYNGAYLYNQQPLGEIGQGVIAGSLRLAFRQYPELFNQYFGSASEVGLNGLVALNNALATSGFFIYVPDNVVVEKAVQLVNLVDTKLKPFIQTRNLVILGKNAQLTFLQCDDSINDTDSFLNSVSEFHIGEGSKLELYKLQNKDNESVLINTSFFNLKKNSALHSNTITYNGGTVRNESIVNLDGEGAHADIAGLYLVDKKQHVDNQVLIRHNVPHCTSNELFKGILDDEATVAFNGHIIVAPGAQKTEAYQSNKNILLTNDAHVVTKPFLEIYADDVKCSHGATVGQLDDEALFYIKQRGICEKNAKLLLMYAFADEIVQKVEIESLRTRTADMVSRRLKGELHVCDQCILHCSEKDIPAFEIDESKI